MRKLKKGDYVIDLTESQFNELVAIEGNYILTYATSIMELESKIFICKSLLFNRYLQHTIIKDSKNIMTFEEFKERAINTFTL